MTREATASGVPGNTAPAGLGLSAFVIGALSLALASQDVRGLDPDADLATAALLSKRLFQCQERAAELEAKLEARHSWNPPGGRTPVDPVSPSSVAEAPSGSSRLYAASAQLHSIQELVDGRYRLMLDGEGRLADELYSVDYYLTVIRSTSSTPTERSSAFLHLSYLDNGTNYMAGLEGDWTREVLKTRDEEDMLRLVAAAVRVPRNETIKFILFREARSQNDLVRSEAIRALVDTDLARRSIARYQEIFLNRDLELHSRLRALNVLRLFPATANAIDPVADEVFNLLVYTKDDELEPVVEVCKGTRNESIANGLVHVLDNSANDEVRWEAVRALHGYLHLPHVIASLERASAREAGSSQRAAREVLAVYHKEAERKR